MKKKKIFVNIILILAFLLILLILMFKGCDKKREKLIIFKDPVFESMIKESLKKDKIYPSDLKGYSGILIAADRLMSFSGNGKDTESIILYGYDTFEYRGVRYTEFGTMKTLEDLKHFPDLISIRVYLQPEIDYNTIPNKDKIYNLNLSQNKISDITFLDGYNKLVYLNLSSNEIVNLDGIENLMTLRRLLFNSNDIVNIDLLKGLINIEELDLTYNQVNNLNPLTNLNKLEYLSLYENGLSDISPVSKIKSLRELYLNNNNITDISSLKDFASFDVLNISGNPITNIEVISHIEYINE